MNANIALMDLNHTTVGIHTETTPLSIGLIGSYAEKQFGDAIKVQLYKFEHDLAKDLTNGWIPDVVGGAMYSWNARLNLHFVKYLKQINPRALAIVGGPDVPTKS